VTRRSLPRKLALVGEILLTYGCARWLLWRRDLPRTLDAIRSNANRSTGRADGVAVALGLARPVARTLSVLPTDSRCLMRALVLSGLLERRGIASALVIGVQPGERFGAHAWVEVGGLAVLDSGGDDFARLVEL
jgi:hypothetical protein